MSILTGPISALKAGRLLLSNPRLIPLALLPAFVTCAVSIAGVWLAISYGDDLIARIWTEPDPGWLHWVWWTTIQLVRISSALLAIVINPWLVLLFGVPLAAPLATATDEIMGGNEVDIPLLKGLGRTMSTALVLSALGITGSALLFFLGFIPVVGVLMGPIATFLWTPTILCYDLYDGAMSRRQADLRTRVRTVLERPATSWSVGLTGLALISVPVLNLIGLPIAVISGVTVIRDLEDKGLLHFPSEEETQDSPMKS